MNNIDKVGKSGNVKVNRDLFVEVPRGWSRGLEKESVFYISPSSDCLRSKEDVARYLISDTTCKCGLECPIYLDKVFNFDASIPSRHYKVGQLNKSGHNAICSLSMGAVNAFKNKSWVKRDDNKGQTIKVNKKPSQSKKTSCSKKKTGGTSGVPAISVVKQGNKIQECITVHSTNAPIAHSYVKSNIQTKGAKEAVVSSTQYTPRVAVTTTTEEHVSALNPISTLPFPSSHLNASSYLASLSSSGAPGSLSSLPLAGESITTTHSFPTTNIVDMSSLGRKPVSSIFGASSVTTNNHIYLSGGAHILTNSKPGLPGSPAHVNITPLPTGTTSAEKLTHASSKGGFPMAVTGNTRSALTASSTTNYKYLPPYMVSSTTISTGTTDATKSLPKSFFTQPDQLLSTKAAIQVSSRVQQSPRMNNTTTSVKREPVSSSISTTMGIQNEKLKATTTNTCESLNQQLQYCGILLQPTAGMVPQVQVAATSSSRTPNLSTVNFQGVDPAHLTSFNVLPGIPLSNNVAPSAVLGMSPGTFVPCVLGIAPTIAAARSTQVSTNVSTSSTSTSVVTTATSTGSAAIAAAYSAFVSIAPASGTSSSYSQQLMNLVGNYSHPYWQQLLSHTSGANALAYQLMQMNQYAALRGSTGQPSAKAPKNTGVGQHQAKQSSPITTSSCSGYGRSTSQGTGSTPVAVVVVNPKDLPYCSTSSKPINPKLPMTVKALSKPNTNVENSVEKATGVGKSAEKHQVYVESACKNASTTLASSSNSDKVTTTQATCNVVSQLKTDDTTQRVDKQKVDYVGITFENNSSYPNKGSFQPDQKSTNDKNISKISLKHDQESLEHGNESAKCVEQLTKHDHQLSKNDQRSIHRDQSSTKDEHCSLEYDQVSLKHDQRSFEHGQRTLEHGQRTLEHDQRTLEHDQRTLERNQRTLEHDQRSFEHDQRSFEHDQRSFEHDRGSFEHGQRTLEHDQRTLEHDQRALEHGQQHTLEHDQRTLEHNQRILQHDQRSFEHDQRTLEHSQRSLEHDQRSVKHDQRSLDDKRSFEHDQDVLEHNQRSIERIKRSVEHDPCSPENNHRSLGHHEQSTKHGLKVECEQILPKAIEKSNDSRSVESHHTEHSKHDTSLTSDIKVENNRSASNIPHDMNTNISSGNLHQTIPDKNKENMENLNTCDLSSDFASHDKTSKKAPAVSSSEIENTINTNENNSMVLEKTNFEENSIDNDMVKPGKISEEINEKCTDDKQSVSVTSLESDVLKETAVNTENNHNSDNNEGSKKNKELACGVDNVVPTKDPVVHNVNKVVQNGEPQSTSNADNSNNDNIRGKEPEVYDPTEFTIGDVVWAQARGLPSWPGKIVDEKDVGNGSGRADNGKKWVRWFGDHTFSQVEVEKLKTLTDGLKTLDDNKGKKRKYRGKKTRIGLEQAIGEALEELEERQNSRSRHGSKAKKRRLRF